MSDTVRDYSKRKTANRLYTQEGSRRGRPHFIRWTFFALLGMLLTWSWWVSRDTRSEGEFIPAGQTYELVLNDLLHQRHIIAGSHLWSLFAASPEAGAVPTLLRNDFGMPPWVLRNLVSGPCHISGADLIHFSDLLVVTRMSRIGCLLERFHTFADFVQDEEAGGLKLRYLPEAKLFYAVRGRILVVTPSRDRLIESLTLAEGAALGDGVYETAVNAITQPQLQLVSSADDPIAPYVTGASITFSFVENGLQVHATWQPGNRMAPLVQSLFGSGAHRELKIPDSGNVRLAADLGASPSVLWSLACEEFGFEPRNDARDALLAPLLADPALQAMLMAWWETDGQPFWLSWEGMDPNAMIPMPLLLGGVTMPVAPVAALLAAAPFAPADGSLLPTALFAEPDRSFVYLPLIGGPALEPAFAPVRNEVAFSLSSPVLRGYVAASREPAASRRTVKANLYVEAYPAACTASLREPGMALAAFGGLRGFTAASFDAWLQSWEAHASQIPFAALALNMTADGAVTLGLDLRFSE